MSLAIETHELTPRGVTLQAEDIREGVVGVLSVFVEEPQYLADAAGLATNGASVLEPSPC